MRELNKREFSDLLEITQASIPQFKNGKRIPSKEILEKMASVLNVSIEELTGDEHGIIAKKQLISKINRLSLESIETLIKMAEFLDNQESISKDVKK